jgi:hypothetical protein
MCDLERSNLHDEAARRRCWEHDVEKLKNAGRELRREFEASEPIFVELVTLDQIAAAVHKSKRTLENYKDEMPTPTVKGGGGRAALWPWREIKPWLEGIFGVPLPNRFPASRAHLP